MDGEEVKSLHLIDIFNKAFPIFLNYGMTYSQFWDDDPLLAVAYRTAYQHRLNDQNYIAWLQGAYVNQALTVNLSHLTSKHSRAEYLKEPYQIFDIRTEEEKLDEEKNRALAWMQTLVAGGKGYARNGRT